ncbi:MAG: PAS domain-containing protein, partial [Betaproteobacteria bacterium]
MQEAKAHTDNARRRRILDALPGGGRLLQIIWPFLVIVIVLLALSIESMTILVAARSYSEGESLWSKGQKRAMFSLLRYTETRNSNDYYKYREAIAVPMGDQKTRLELEKPDPDMAIAWAGFIEGRNHPDDIPGMIMLYRTFRNIDFMAAVIDLWTEGDRYIAELNAVAEELHATISGGRDTPEALHGFRERILEIDTRLTPLTDQFTRTLGDATRKTKTLLLIANLAAAAILLPIGIWLSRRMVRYREKAEEELKLSQERFRLAVSGSNDGLWDWSIASGHMYYSPRFEQLLGYED